MTVSTVVAGLLPIMWSTRTGAEVMRPLATPVLGGMVSSLLHVLVVTPVVFYWLRSRHLPDVEAAAVGGVAAPARDAVRVLRAGKNRAPLVAVAAIATVAVIAIAWPSLRRVTSVAEGKDVQAVTSGDIRATLRSASGTLTRGRNQFSIAFADARGRPIDAGDVRLSATMAMPGMVMSGGVEVARTSTVGYYTATGEFGMAGVWQMTLQWNGPAGHGTASFDGRVQ